MYRNKKGDFIMKFKNKKIRYVITFIAVLASSLLQTFAIKTFVQSAGLLSSGFTGVAILIDRIASLYGGFTISCPTKGNGVV